VNYTLIVINVAVFLYMLTLSTDIPGTRAEAQAAAEMQAREVCYGRLAPPSEQERFYCEWGFQPREFIDAVQGDLRFPESNRQAILLSIVTSIFMHAGILHILGNLLFLWVFGDNVEDRFGHLVYLLFYLAGGMAATLLQAAIDTSSVVPVVGASGAISAVLGAYLVMFPLARVTILFPIFIILFPLSVPAFLLIGLWFVQNFLAGIAEVTGTAAGSGVAFFAHIGGFLFGLGLAPLLRYAGGRPRPRYR
jgi:membrane associated rhomboid family serine protease